MKHIALILAAATVSFGTAQATEPSDSILQEVVITGTRAATDVRHLSQTVNVVDRAAIEETNRTSLLPLLTQQVPGLFITQRGYAGYGVSGGAAGNISMRGMSGSSARMLILIDGHPNYAGIYGHPIADSYQSLMTAEHGTDTVAEKTTVQTDKALFRQLTDKSCNVLVFNIGVCVELASFSSVRSLTIAHEELEF